MKTVMLSVVVGVTFAVAQCEPLVVNNGPRPEAPSDPVPDHARGSFDAYVNYVIADIELGGSSVYDGYKSHNIQSVINSTDAYDQAVRSWDLGIRTCNLNEFERIPVDGLAQLVYAGTQDPIESGSVVTTKDQPGCLTNALPAVPITSGQAAPAGQGPATAECPAYLSAEECVNSGTHTYSSIFTIYPANDCAASLTETRPASAIETEFSDGTVWPHGVHLCGSPEPPYPRVATNTYANQCTTIEYRFDGFTVNEVSSDSCRSTEIFALVGGQPVNQPAPAQPQPAEAEPITIRISNGSCDAMTLWIDGEWAIQVPRYSDTLLWVTPGTHRVHYCKAATGIADCSPDETVTWAGLEGLVVYTIPRTVANCN